MDKNGIWHIRLRADTTHSRAYMKCICVSKRRNANEMLALLARLLSGCCVTHKWKKKRRTFYCRWISKRWLWTLLRNISNRWRRLAFWIQFSNLNSFVCLWHTQLDITFYVSFRQLWIVTSLTTHCRCHYCLAEQHGICFFLFLAVVGDVVVVDKFRTWSRTSVRSFVIHLLLLVCLSVSVTSGLVQ